MDQRYTDMNVLAGKASCCNKQSPNLYGFIEQRFAWVFVGLLFTKWFRDPGTLQPGFHWILFIPLGNKGKERIAWQVLGVNIKVTYCVSAPILLARNSHKASPIGKGAGKCSLTGVGRKKRKWLWRVPSQWATLGDGKSKPCSGEMLYKVLLLQFLQCFGSSSPNMISQLLLRHTELSQ